MGPRTPDSRRSGAGGASAEHQPPWERSQPGERVRDARQGFPTGPHKRKNPRVTHHTASGSTCRAQVARAGVGSQQVRRLPPLPPPPSRRGPAGVGRSDSAARGLILGSEGHPDFQGDARVSGEVTGPALASQGPGKVTPGNNCIKAGEANAKLCRAGPTGWPQSQGRPRGGHVASSGGGGVRGSE